MQPAVQGAWRLNASGRRGRGNEQQEDCALLSNCPTQAKRGLECATRATKMGISIRSPFFFLSSRPPGGICIEGNSFWAAQDFSPAITCLDSFGFSR